MSRRWNGRVNSVVRRSDPVRVRAVREMRRRILVEETVSRLGEASTHERVAHATGLPLGYLRWTYPTVEDLRAVRGAAS